MKDAIPANKLICVVWLQTNLRNIFRIRNLQWRKHPQPGVVNKPKKFVVNFGHKLGSKQQKGNKTNQARLSGTKNYLILLHPTRPKQCPIQQSETHFLVTLLPPDTLKQEEHTISTSKVSLAVDIENRVCSRLRWNFTWNLYSLDCKRKSFLRRQCEVSWCSREWPGVHYLKCNEKMAFFEELTPPSCTNKCKALEIVKWPTSASSISHAKAKCKSNVKVKSMRYATA